MQQIEYKINKKEMRNFLIEIKLSINHSLFEKGVITEEMYTKAKEMIIKS